MKKIMNKNFIQKIVITILIVLSFNFVMPTFSRADFGGILLGPVIDLLAGIGDSVMAILQVFMDTSNNVSLSSSGFLIKSDEFRDEISNLGMDKGAGLKEVQIKASELDHGWLGWGTYCIPIIQYGPEKIFSNEVPALDANFINPKKYDNDEQNSKSIAQQLRSTISSWYNSLRNLVVVLLLSILLYVAIRMILSSAASDKSKYKQMLMDWLVALCLLFFLHYIMSFTMTVTEIITEGISGGTDINVTIVEEDPTKNITFKTNLTGLCRMQVQYQDLGTRMIYLLFYIGLVIYTVKFSWEYMKRAITMAFLTLMAPLVTLTYPIDKIGDGKAQAFNMWLKEYIFNALLQPFHLIIYTIFLGAAMDIVKDNPLYAIFVLAFITPAEKLLRKFFGFDKASTAGSSFAGGFGGAAAFNAVKGAVNKGAAAINHGKGGNGKSGDNNIRTQKPIKSDDAPKGYEAFSNSGEGNNQIEDGNNNPQNGTEESAQQRMLDAYDEGYGTDEWDPQEREAMSREAYAQNNTGMDYSDEEYANILRESGYEEDEIANMMGNSNTQSESQPVSERASTTPTTNNIKSSTEPKRSIKNGIKNVGRRMFTSENLKKAGKFVGRTAVRTAMAGTMGAIGLAAGITGDNLEDVFTYGAAGITLGATAGANMVMGAGKKIAGGARSIADTYKEGYYGVKEAQMRRQTEEFMKNDQIREQMAQEFTNENGQRLKRKELDQVMEKASYYYNSGVTDVSKIQQSIKLEHDIKEDLADNNGLSDEQKADMARRQSVTIAKIADKVDDAKFSTDEKYREGWRNDFERGIKKDNPNLSEKNVKENTEQMMKLLCKYKKLNYTKN